MQNGIITNIKYEFEFEIKINTVEQDMNLNVRTLIFSFIHQNNIDGLNVFHRDIKTA